MWKAGNILAAVEILTAVLAGVVLGLLLEDARLCLAVPAVLIYVWAFAEMVRHGLELGGRR